MWNKSKEYIKKGKSLKYIEADKKAWRHAVWWYEKHTQVSALAMHLFVSVFCTAAQVHFSTHTDARVFLHYSASKHIKAIIVYRRNKFRIHLFYILCYFPIWTNTQKNKKSLYFVLGEDGNREKKQLSKGS